MLEAGSAVLLGCAAGSAGCAGCTVWMDCTCIRLELGRAPCIDGTIRTLLNVERNTQWTIVHLPYLIAVNVAISHHSCALQSLVSLVLIAIN